jgi:hypothetical protein
VLVHQSIHGWYRVNGPCVFLIWGGFGLISSAGVSQRLAANAASASGATKGAPAKPCKKSADVYTRSSCGSTMLPDTA